MTEALTTNLRLELEKTTTIFNSWSDGQKEWLHDDKSNYDRRMEEYECTILSLKENDEKLEQSRQLNEDEKKQQKHAIDQLNAQNQRLILRKEALEKEMEHYKNKDGKGREELTNVQAEHEELRKQMEHSLNELTHGTKQYAALGLEFSKDNTSVPGLDCMKFIFTQIDQLTPSRECYFLLYVDENNLYQLVDTSPQLDNQACLMLLNNLNINNDLCMFVVSMRKMFCRLIRK
jgi:hypothetical protein